MTLEDSPSLFSAILNKHFLFIQHSCHSFWYTWFIYIYVYVKFCSLPFPPSLSSTFSLLALFYFIFLHLPSSSSSSSRNLRQLSSIIRWTGQRYTSFPSPDLFFLLLCHSPPLPYLLLSFDISFHAASVRVQHGFVHLSMCVTKY